MKRVLFITATPFTPANQGNSQRALQMLEIYKQLGYSVTVLYHEAERPFDFNDRDDTKDTVDILRVVTTNTDKSSFLDPITHQANPDDWFDGYLLLKSEIELQRSLYHFDVVHVNYVWYSKAFEYFPNSLKVIDTHDVFSNRDKVFTKAGLKPEWFSTSIDAEREALLRADMVLAISTEDAREFLCLGVVPTYLPYYREPCRRKPEVGYIAADNDFNRLAVRHLLLSFSQLTHRNFILNIAGSICKYAESLRVLGLADNEVVYSGYVKHLDEFYSSIDLAVNPAKAGTGLKIKTIEAMMYGVPVVTTSAGSTSALDNCHSRSVTVVKDTDELVRACQSRFEIEGIRPYVNDYLKSLSFFQAQLKS